MSVTEVAVVTQLGVLSHLPVTSHQGFVFPFSSVFCVFWRLTLLSAQIPSCLCVFPAVVTARLISCDRTILGKTVVLESVWSCVFGSTSLRSCDKLHLYGAAVLRCLHAAKVLMF